AWRTGLTGSALLHGMLWLLGIEAVALGLFVLVQTRGMLGWTLRLLERLGVRPPRGQATLGRVDDALEQFYRTAPERLGLSIGVPTGLSPFAGRRAREPRSTVD